MGDKLLSFMQLNYITLLIVCVFIVSIVLGFSRGASASVKQLIKLIADGAFTIIAIIMAWQISEELSPWLQVWLYELHLEIPNEQLGFLKQLYYTIVTGLRDFSLLRFAAIFVPAYFAIRALLGFSFYFLAGSISNSQVSNKPNK